MTTIRAPTMASDAAMTRRMTGALVPIDIRAPTCAPRRIPAPIRPTVGRCTWPRVRNVSAPAHAEMLSTKCEVAVATWTGRPRTTIRKGTWMMPPPIPKTLEITPTARLTRTPFQTSTL